MEHHKHVMEVSVTAYGKTISIRQPDDVDIHEFLDMCKSLATGIGYHEESWTEGVIDMADEYTAEEVMERRGYMGYPFNSI